MCQHCHRWGNTDCEIAVCLGCGTSQCFYNGAGKGTCSSCGYGILPGWSGSKGTCSYVGCTEPAAFAYCPGGKRYVCHAHAQRVKVTTYQTVNNRMVTVKVPLTEYAKARKGQGKGTRS